MAAALAVVAPAHGQGFEGPPTVYLGDVLDSTLISSGNHRVLDEVRTEGRTLQFDIESDYGSYRVRSLPMVSLRVHEIRTLAQAIDQFERDNTRLANQLRGQLQVGGDSFVQILASPIQSASSIVGQFANNVGDTFKELNDPGVQPERGGATESSGAADYYRRYEPGDPVLASYRRSIASQLDLDVYSTNPRVQEFLNTVAGARAGGQRSAGTVSVTIPRGPEAQVAGGRIQTAVRNQLTHMTVREVYKANHERLVGMGIDSDLAHRFLRHPPISPRHATLIAGYLGFLDGVENRGALLEAALSSRDEQDAMSYVQAGRILGVYHEKQGPLSALLSSGHIPVALTRAGAIVVVVPYDVVYWDAQTSHIFTELSKLAAERHFTARVILANGTVTRLAQGELELRGFTVRPRYLIKG